MVEIRLCDKFQTIDDETLRATLTHNYPHAAHPQVRHIQTLKWENALDDRELAWPVLENCARRRRHEEVVLHVLCSQSVIEKAVISSMTRPFSATFVEYPLARFTADITCVFGYGLQFQA